MGGKNQKGWQKIGGKNGGKWKKKSNRAKK